MKHSFAILASSLATMTFTLTACNSDSDIVADNQSKDGYFTATFFPQQKSANTRAAVNGSSNLIQSLKCLIYKKQSDDTYKYETEQSVIDYEGAEGNIDAQLHEWPLEKSVQFELPSGDYKAVFVGNVDKKLFSEQSDEILTSYQGVFDDARINLPTKGAPAYNAYNMPYLCTVDFSASNPSPSVLMQRVAAKNVYGRDFIDTNDALKMLANNIVKQVREKNLTTDIVKGVLNSTILKALNDAGLGLATEALTKLVDQIVNLILGDVLEKLNEALLQEVLGRLENALEGEGSSSLLGLGYILNPWTTVGSVDVTYSSLPKSIDFNRTCKSYLSNTTWENINIDKDDNNNSTFSIVSLCGDGKVKEINVDKTSSSYNVLTSVLSSVDDNLLNGLLINIHVPLAYTQQSNLQYSTTYDLLNLTLSDFSAESSGKPVSLSLNLKDIVDVEGLVKNLLGDNILTQAISGLTNSLLQPLVTALNKVVIEKLDIQLPGLNLSNIVLEGGWNVTYVSDGTVAPSEKE